MRGSKIKTGMGLHFCR